MYQVLKSVNYYNYKDNGIIWLLMGKTDTLKKKSKILSNKGGAMQA